MTLDKEAILNNEHWKFVEEVGLTSIHTKTFPEAYREQALRAMDSYAASLLKENEELKEALTSTEKAYEIMRDKSERLEKELLAAKNLIWKAFYLSVCDLPDDEQLKYWQEFKAENNLTEKLPQRVIE